MFLVTDRKGLYRSIDAGANWEDLEDGLDEFHVGNNIQDVLILNSDSKVIYLASSYTLLRSLDNGTTWTKLELLTPDRKSDINALAANPQNSEEIYYVTNSTFYKSTDGGSSWTPRKLPTSRAGWKILVDPNDEDTLYLGIKSFEK